MLKNACLGGQNLKCLVDQGICLQTCRQNINSSPKPERNYIFFKIRRFYIGTLIFTINLL